jgi:hypothetical protein
LKSSWEWATAPVIDSTTFPLHRVNNVPQQPNGYDCGVFSIMYIDALLASLPKTAADINIPNDLDATAARHTMSRIIQQLSSSSSSSPSSATAAAAAAAAAQASPQLFGLSQIGDNVSNTHTHTHIYIYICTHTHFHTHSLTHTHTHMQTHIHTHASTHTHTNSLATLIVCLLCIDHSNERRTRACCSDRSIKHSNERRRTACCSDEGIDRVAHRH